MNKEDVMKQFYLKIEQQVSDVCYDREYDKENKYECPIKEENLIMSDERVAGICYKNMKWDLEEVGQVRTDHMSEHMNGMWSIYTTIKVELRKKEET